MPLSEVRALPYGEYAELLLYAEDVESGDPMPWELMTKAERDNSLGDAYGRQ